MKFFLIGCLLLLVAVEFNNPLLMAVKKKVVYEASLAYTRATQPQWYSQITVAGTANHYLGAQPLDDLDHALEIYLVCYADSVLVMLEAFERTPGWFHTPVSEAQWLELGIGVKWVAAEDFAPLTTAALTEAVNFMANETAAGRRVYVHCKAGRGRSASVMIAFVMHHLQWNYDDAYALVKAQRPSININAYQREAILAWRATLGQEI